MNATERHARLVFFVRSHGLDVAHVTADHLWVTGAFSQQEPDGNGGWRTAYHGAVTERIDATPAAVRIWLGY